MDTYLKSGKTLSDTTILTAVRNAIAVNELNAKMGLVCATPTAGSAGCLPAVLTTAIDKLKLSEEEQLNFFIHCWCFLDSLLEIMLQSLALKVAVKLKLALLLQ